MPHLNCRLFIFSILVFTFSNCGYKISESSFGGGQFAVPQKQENQLKFNVVNDLAVLENNSTPPIVYNSETISNSEIPQQTKNNFSQNTSTKSLNPFVAHSIKQTHSNRKRPSKSLDTKPEGPMNFWQTVETILGFVIGMAALVLGNNFFMSMLTIWSGIIAYRMNTSIKNLRYYKKESGLKTLSIITLIIGAITIALNLPQLSLLIILGIGGITLITALALLGITKYLIFKFVK